MSDTTQLAEKIIDVLRLNIYRATVQEHDPNRIGYANVIVETSEGVALRRSVRCGYTSTQMQPGTPVIVGYDRDRELSIIGIDFQRQVEAGLNPAANNAADRYFYGATLQDTIQTLQCHPFANDSMLVVIRPWFAVLDGTWHELPEQQLDLTAYIPSSGNHRLAAVWVKPDFSIEVTTSTEQNLLDGLDLTDAQECQDAVTDVEANPARFWRLYAGMAGIKETDSWRDARQIINSLQHPLTVEDGTVSVTHVKRLIFSGASVTNVDTGIAFVEVSGGGYAYDYDPYAFHSNYEYEFYVLSEKITLVDDDLFVIEDSEYGYTKKKVKSANLPGGAGGSVITVGNYADTRPASPSAGDVFIARDGVYPEIYDSSWKFFGEGKVSVKPSDQTWAWINQSGASIASVNGAEHLYTSTSAGSTQNLNIRKKAIPSLPYTITARLRVSEELQSTALMGICFRESSSGKLSTILLSQASGTGLLVYAVDYTNPTTQSASNANITVWNLPEWLRITDDNVANRTFEYSYDGVNFKTLYSVGRTTFLTADEVGFFVNPYAISSQIDLTLLEWIEA